MHFKLNQVSHSISDPYAREKIDREGIFFLDLVLGKPFDCQVDENFQIHICINQVDK